MPPSQLKRLKSSLREQGITGPQKSKKQKKQQRNAGQDQRAQKAAALASIRESFNPFEFKHLARPKKFDYVTNRPDDTKKVLGRPGVTKSQGEEARKKNLLPEMNKRNKVGGILDRRIGENDPTMSLDDRMMARFEREQQRKKGGNVFDLEEADDEVELTHGGRSLRLDDGEEAEDYDAASIEGSSDGESDNFLRRKRGRDSKEEEDDGVIDEAEQPERKKSKAEVMKEVIAKSKLHKYERQQQKDDDEDLREELDKGLPDILAALRGHINKKPEPLAPPKEVQLNNFGINPDRLALLDGKSREQADKEYDTRVRQLLQDQRAKPTERTKTEEEQAKDEARRLKDLEEKRMRRMKGEAESESDADSESEDNQDQDQDRFEKDVDDAAEFGFSSTLPQGTRPHGVEDEDDFLMDDGLVASDSEADVSDDSEEEPDRESNIGMDDDEDFLKDVLPEKKTDAKTADSVLPVRAGTTSSKLAYTYQCPRSHEELLLVFKDVPVADLPTVVQRIRAVYHAGLHPENREKLADFACALVDHISYLSNQNPVAPLGIVEALIRHVHSMSRAYPSQIATHIRQHLKQLQASNDPTSGDLTILTAVGTIYPTSDHFHQVVTPAITLMARWMGLTSPTSEHNVAVGAYIGALCLHYQRLSKRYIPEFIRFTKLCLNSPHLKQPLLAAHTKNVLTAADLWSSTPAFIEIFTPLLQPLKAQGQTSAVQRLKVLLQNAKLHRRPQTLHFHRPLPIKQSIPKFEEAFDPNKHYDPDPERADATRLRKEYKRERKGAMRELRKDANFIAREKLREKKEKDRAYEEKHRKLISEINAEEGRKKNEYEREKRARTRR